MLTALMIGVADKLCPRAHCLGRETHRARTQPWKNVGSTPRAQRGRDKVRLDVDSEEEVPPSAQRAQQGARTQGQGKPGISKKVGISFVITTVSY